jgi:hypothetical protein
MSDIFDFTHDTTYACSGHHILLQAVGLAVTLRSVGSYCIVSWTTCIHPFNLLGNFISVYVYLEILQL